MPHIADGITFKECELVFGEGSPICGTFRHITAQATIIFGIFNPFNKPLVPVARALSNAVKGLIPSWNAVTQSTFEFVTFGIKGNNEIRIFLREFEEPAQIAPILAAIAVFVAVLIAFGVFLGWVRVVETKEATKRAEIALEAKKTDAEIIDQLNRCVEAGSCTQDEVTDLIKTLFPKGISGDPDNTTRAVDDNTFGDFTRQITGAVNIIIPLAILGAVIAVVPRKR